MLNPWVGFTARVTPGFTLRATHSFTLWATPSLTMQETPSLTPQVTPVWHSASLPKQHLASDLHLTVCTPTLHCPDSHTPLSGQLHSITLRVASSFTLWVTLASLCRRHPASHLMSHLSGTQLHSPSNTWLYTCTSLTAHLHFTVQTAALHCPDGSPPFVPRYSWQKNNHKFHINNIASVFHKCFHKSQSFFKTSRNPQFT